MIIVKLQSECERTALEVHISETHTHYTGVIQRLDNIEAAFDRITSSSVKHNKIVLCSAALAVISTIITTITVFFNLLKI